MAAPSHSRRHVQPRFILTAQVSARGSTHDAERKNADHHLPRLRLGPAPSAIDPRDGFGGRQRRHGFYLHERNGAHHVACCKCQQIQPFDAINREADGT